MDYKKIYDDLIESRKMRPKLEGVYYEEHHILAKCMGGSNEKSNLIYLTAREHFLAHLLLAQVYGGELWFAAQAMTMTSSGRKLNSRMFSLVREQWSKEIRKFTTSTVIHKFVVVETGETFDCTQKELRARHGLTLADSSNLVRRICQISKGIALAETDLTNHARAYKDQPYMSRDKTKYEFRCLSTGEVFNFTKSELVAHLGTTSGRVGALVRGKVRTTSGFCLNATTDFTCKPRPNIRRHKFRIIETGEVLERTTKQLKEEYNLSISSIEGLIKGSCKTYKGFCMDSTPADDPGLIRRQKGFVVTIRKIDDGTLYTGSSVELRDKWGISPDVVGKLIGRNARCARGFELVRDHSVNSAPTPVGAAAADIREFHHPSESLPEHLLIQGPQHHTVEASQCGQPAP
jgi:hypothetical protein